MKGQNWQKVKLENRKISHVTEKSKMRHFVRECLILLKISK